MTARKRNVKRRARAKSKRRPLPKPPPLLPPRDGVRCPNCGNEEGIFIAQRHAEAGDFDVLTCPNCGWNTDSYEMFKAWESARRPPIEPAVEPAVELEPWQPEFTLPQGRSAPGAYTKPVGG